ncbi:NADP-dependent phosphogluconate dehydrogenase [Enterococcus thailandicus]|uniref:NADP-dependent phosphogluconate dehydrogenase n=1 Tax=Enterococcus thailandicus TaxID=417368 RepID=UPI0022EBB8B5|nr:NADP-dependent phosphogluconate dehydrogenase [Enterococcus thailandicus]MDA3972766.1 NADP-dependent phosphogluconate dehydrogenase [Enterococcus thailandicus]MDA3975262.1 NADP-dependent phosphogluconate dehydrogenase [Enterococcus thailandicus]MDA3980226.1 NADP-dependent phosphogluconate dehydrogenase [Enterococcus thailandicus]
MSKPTIGVIGMAVMGKNLALNIESRGNIVAIYNRSADKTHKVIQDHPNKRLVPSYSIEDFVKSLEKPRRIIMMVQAGRGTDSVISELVPLLDEGDVLVDGGNTFFEDTIRRNSELDKSNIYFMGMGVSGGELGALKGPSLMPGGQREAYDLMSPILEEISAKADEDGKPCVAYIGPNGAGHYVKMVHNGIEYGDMELIAESYSIMRNMLSMPVDKIAEVFTNWSEGELSSYLIDITADILTRKDDQGTGKPIIDVILDSAGNKGTGEWSTQNATELGVPQSVITESLYARYISTMKDERMEAAKQLPKPITPFGIDYPEDIVELIRKALYFSKLMSYAQGFEQMRVASDRYDWNLNYGELAQIWRAGCIIRAEFLQNITDAFNKKPKLKNLLLDDYFKKIARDYQEAVRDLIGYATKVGIPVPGFMAAISYYDSYRSEILPANLIQAQRDYFGAHTYHRNDQSGVFHFPWYEEQ